MRESPINQWSVVLWFMSEKRILVADSDPQTAGQFAKALGGEWQVKGVASGEAALAALESEPFGAIVASLGLPELDGPQLLNRVRQKFPNTARFLIAEEADRERVLKEGLGTQQFLTKPCNAAAIKSALENAASVGKWIEDDGLRELVSRIRSLPTIPSIYLEVRAALKSSDASAESIGAVIVKDMAMTTKLLQVCNSSYFGLPRKITDPGEAVARLGFDTVNSIVVAVKMLGYYDRIKPAYYSVDKLWKHSQSVAHHARAVAMWQTSDRVLAESAYTAGLMHDLGKVVLACNFCQDYELAQNAARQQIRPLWQVEKEVFGASHAEIGAYLLGKWGLPADVLEAAALHHSPWRTGNGEFSVLTAVHVADGLEHEANPSGEGWPASPIDTIYLAKIGCLDQLPHWRESVTGKTNVPAANSPGSVTAFRTREVKKPETTTPVAPVLPVTPVKQSWYAGILQWIASLWQGPSVTG